MSSPIKQKGKRPEIQQTRKAGILSLFRKAFTESNEDWDKEELLDVIHWQRQALALFCGVAWGLTALTGFWAFAGFVALNIISVLSWWRTQRIDEDEYGGMQALIGEGLPPSIGLFLCTWILTYTAVTGSK